MLISVLKRGSLCVTWCAKGQPAGVSPLLPMWVLRMELRSGLAANALTQVNFISISPSFITSKNNLYCFTEAVWYHTKKWAQK